MQRTLRHYRQPITHTRSASHSHLPSSHLPWLLALLLAFLGAGCQPCCTKLDPNIGYTPPPSFFNSLPTPFANLENEERAEDWGKELFVGKAFAKEMDFYRAITSFKKALFLIPREAFDRRAEIEYDIFLSYYAAGKNREAVEAFEGSSLMCAQETFPAYKELLTTVYDAYLSDCQPERAAYVWNALDKSYPEAAYQLTLSTAIRKADFPIIAEAAANRPEADSINAMLSCYCSQAKSPSTARMLNALLPGAGYWYVGQKQSALTSFLINAVFIAASYQLFDRGYIPAAIITTSLEVGWYLGGINGAALEAKQYNLCLYDRLGREALIDEKLFPILMLEYGF